MKPKIGIFINNRTTAGLARQFLHGGDDLPYEPVFLVPSSRFKAEVHGDAFDAFEFRFIGGDYPWRSRKRFRVWTLFYLLSFLRVRSASTFTGLQALVLFKDDGTLDRVLALKARRTQLPVICIQEEAIYERASVKRPERPGGRVLDVIADRIEGALHPDLPAGETKEKGLLCTHNIVYGEKKRDRLRACGYPEDRIFVLGHPFYDGLRSSEPPAEPPRKLLFAHQQTFDGLKDEFAWYEALAGGAAAVGASLVFKLHPRSKTKAEHVRAYFGDSGNVEIGPPGDVQAAPLDCGLFVTGDSAAVNRALGDGVVPLLLNGANPAGRRLDLADRGAAIEAWTPVEARAVVVSFFEDAEIRQRCLSQRADAIQAHLGPLDGGARSRYNQTLFDLASADRPL
jgi:hypothetical protein